MRRRTFFRFLVVVLALHYWADAGRDLVVGGGSVYGWIHMVLACLIVPMVIGAAWRYSRIATEPPTPDAGPCGHPRPRFEGQPLVRCTLLAGHAGLHVGDDKSSWGPL